MSDRRLHHVPVQVYLEPRQLELLRDLAARRSEPLTRLVRESVERYLVDEVGDQDPLLGLVGLIDSGEADTAVEHDRVIAEDEMDRMRREPPRQRASATPAE